MGGGADTDVDGAVAKANGYLTDALALGLPYSERFNKQAIEAQKQATEQARSDLNTGFERSQALGAPYRLAGYQALDSYMDTLTLARPEMGSFKLATALDNTAKREAALTELGADVSNVQKYNPFTYGVNPDRDPLASNSGMGDVDRSTGLSSPGVWAENALAASRDMLAHNWFPTANKSQGWTTLNDVTKTGGYLNPEYSAQYSSGGGGSIPNASGKPMSANAMLSNTVGDLNKALSDYNRATQYYTPEQGSIAASFNKGMLGTPVWRNV